MSVEGWASPDLLKLQRELGDECVAMIRMADLSGIAVSGQVLSTLERAAGQAGRGASSAEDRLSELLQVHGSLLRLVAPATPAIALAIGEAYANKSRWQIFGPFKITSVLLAISLCSLLFLVGASVRAQDVAIARPSSLATWHVVSVTAAAALGASSLALFELNRHMRQRSFDPRSQGRYAALLALGLAFGLGAAFALELPAGLDTSTGRAALSFVSGAVPWLLLRIGDWLARRAPREKGEPRATPSRDEDLSTRAGLVRALVAIQRRIATGEAPGTVREELASMALRLAKIPAFAAESGAGCPESQRVRTQHG